MWSVDSTISMSIKTIGTGVYGLKVVEGIVKLGKGSVERSEESNNNRCDVRGAVQ